jgi:hypothetical protein
VPRPQARIFAVPVRRGCATAIRCLVSTGCRLAQSTRIALHTICTDHIPDANRALDNKSLRLEPVDCESAGMEIARPTSDPVDLQFMVVGQPAEGDPTVVL